MGYYIGFVNIGGIDWHDTARMIGLVKYKESYKIKEEDIRTAIAEDIFDTLLVPKQFHDSLLEAIQQDKSATFPIYESIEDKEKGLLDEKKASVEISISDGKLSVDYYMLRGQYTGNIAYIIEEIKDGEEEFIVYEEFLCPQKGCPSYHRVAHAPFTKEKDAIAFMKEKNQEEEWKEGKEEHIKSNFTIQVGHMGDIEQKNHYKLDMKALNMANEIGAWKGSPLFSIFTDEHIKNMELATGGTGKTGRWAIYTGSGKGCPLSTGTIVWLDGIDECKNLLENVTVYKDRGCSQKAGTVPIGILKVLPDRTHMSYLLDALLGYEIDAFGYDFTIKGLLESGFSLDDFSACNFNASEVKAVAEEAGIKVSHKDSIIYDNRRYYNLTEKALTFLLMKERDKVGKILKQCTWFPEDGELFGIEVESVFPMFG